VLISELSYFAFIGVLAGFQVWAWFALSPVLFILPYWFLFVWWRFILVVVMRI
jgi:hypothetical protein